MITDERQQMTILTEFDLWYDKIFDAISNYYAGMTEHLDNLNLPDNVREIIVSYQQAYDSIEVDPDGATIKQEKNIMRLIDSVIREVVAELAELLNTKTS